MSRICPLPSYVCQELLLLYIQNDACFIIDKLASVPKLHAFYT